MALQNPYSPNESLGQYYNAANGISGQLFMGGNQAVVATALAAGLPTTYTGGLVLANPLTSTKKLLLQKAKAVFIAQQTNASAIGIGVGYSSTTALSGTLTAITPLAGNPASTATPQGKLYSSASITLPNAPVLAKLIGSVDTGAVTVNVDSAALESDVQGQIVLPPGAYAVFLSSAAGTASSFFGSFTWVEI